MKLAVQLYSLRDQLAADFDAVIPKLEAMKYAGVEPYGGMPVAPEHAAALFKKHGLEVPSSHLPLLTGDDQQKLLDAAHAWELKTIVLPWLPESDFANADAVKRTADKISASAQVAQSAGFRYGYHNHWFEWNMVDGRPAIDHVFELLDPSIIFEIDLYWAQVAGQDPAAVLKQYATRAPLLHLKDGPADVRESPMTAVGDGGVDFDAIFKAANAEWGVVEIDRCATDMIEAVARSSEYLRGRGVQGKA